MNSKEKVVLDIMSTGVSPGNAYAAAANLNYNPFKAIYYSLARQAGVSHIKALNMTKNGSNVKANLSELHRVTKNSRNRQNLMLNYITFRAGGFNHATAISSVRASAGAA